MTTEKKGQGKFTATPFTETLKDGTVINWKGRGRKPLPLLAAIERGESTYVSPSILRKQEQKIAKEAVRAQKKAARQMAKDQKDAEREAKKADKVATQATAPV